MPLGEAVYDTSVTNAGLSATVAYYVKGIAVGIQHQGDIVYKIIYIAL